jgi:hypothetical protein
MSRMTSLHLALVALALQAQDPVVVRGTARTTDGAPVVGANVFLLETLEGALTDSAGRFAVRTTQRGPATLAARRIGYRPAQLALDLRTAPGHVDLVLEAQAATLGTVVARAGAYTAGNERGATLTSIEVATTPGATADVARAMQTLPGVQTVDEGTGLFVRGGDVSETRVFLNDAAMLSPYNYETPTGNYTVTVNPFLLDGIFFSSGGFGARYGNVLSGVAALETQGRPARTTLTGVAGLASVSGSADAALPYGVGVHATAARNDTRLLFRLNGSTRDYAPSPNGADYSGSVAWRYRPTGELKTFAIDRRSALGVTVSDPSFTGGYSADTRGNMVVTSWKDVFRALASSATVSYATSRRDEGFGVFALDDDERWTQAFGEATWSAGSTLALRGGGEVEARRSRFVGSVPDSRADRAPGARVTRFDDAVRGTRGGAFAESDWRPAEPVRVVAGVRGDRSTLTGRATADPRLSAALKVRPNATLTAAWGVYHQVPDPIDFAPGLGTPDLAPMRARQAVLGAQLGEDARVARVELYDKRYADLAQRTLDGNAVVAGGTGYARGADVFLKGPLVAGVSGRVSYSLLDARRTDPATGRLTHAAFDVTHSLTVVADRRVGRAWQVSGAVRYATGKPFTPVSGATYDAERRMWRPIYDEAYGGRLPAFSRVDLSVSRAAPLGPRAFGVFFVSVNNVFDRVNVYDYRYDADYTHRVPVRSLFNRSVYVGGSVTLAAR